MSTADTVAIHLACEKLIHRFLRLLETDQSKIADLFTEDGEAFTHVGRESIRAHFGAIETVDNNVNVNVSSNLVIAVHAPDRASASNYVTHYVAQPSDGSLTDPLGGVVGGELETPRSITRWGWEFRCVDGEWLVSYLKYPESVLLRKDVIDEL